MAAMGTKKMDAQKIDTTDPMEAIEQAANSFRDNQKARKIEGLAAHVYNIPKKFGLSGIAITQVISSRDDLEQLRGKVSDYVFGLIEESYNYPNTAGVHFSSVDIVVIFGDKIKNEADGEHVWWHEQTHSFWNSLPAELRDRYGSVCFNILQKYYPDVHDEIKRNYSPNKWKSEACSFLVENIVKQYGADAFMTNKFGGNQDFINFANKLREFFKNENRQQQGRLSNNQRKGIGSISRGTNAHRGDDLRQERKGDNAYSQTESELQRIEDPLEAIEASARRWRDNNDDIDAANEYSAKQVYQQRIDTAGITKKKRSQDLFFCFLTLEPLTQESNNGTLMGL